MPTDDTNSPTPRRTPPAARRGAPPHYVRERDLPRLVALWPHEVSDLGIAGSTALVEKIRATLRRERVRGQSGHWSYNLNRHKALLGCYRAEVRRLAGLRLAARAAEGVYLTPRPKPVASSFATGSETHFLGEL